MAAIAAGLVYLLVLAVEAAIIFTGFFIALIAFIFGRWAYLIVGVLFVWLLVVSL